MTWKKAVTMGTFLSVFLAFFTPTAKGEAIQRTILQVDNLTCGYCLSQINTGLNTMDGYISMDANLERGIVGVDHRLTLESKEIAEAVTNIGYPAEVLSEMELDENKAFSTSGTTGVGCWGPSGAYSGNLPDEGRSPAGETDETALQRNYTGSGCCSFADRPARTGYCGGSASAWQELKRRLWD